MVNLVSFKINNTWPSYSQTMAHMAIFRHTFFGDNWNFSGSSGDYYLSICDEQSKLRCLFSIFWPLLAGKWACPPHVPLWSSVFKPEQKVRPPGDFLGRPPLSRNQGHSGVVYPKILDFLSFQICLRPYGDLSDVKNSRKRCCS